MAEDRTEGKRKDRVTVKTLKLIDALRAAANAMIAAEPELTELDSDLGDGDCGMGLKTGFTAVLAALEGKDDASADEIMKLTASSLISSIGGTSGAIYGTAFMRSSNTRIT